MKLDLLRSNLLLTCLLSASVAAASMLVGVGTASAAQAAPAWQIRVNSNPTAFVFESPLYGQSKPDHYVVLVENVGGAPSEEGVPIEIEGTLPAGLVLTETGLRDGTDDDEGWNCTANGVTSFVCEYVEAHFDRPVRSLEEAPPLYVGVEVPSGTAPDTLAGGGVFTVSGGGAPEASARVSTLLNPSSSTPFAVQEVFSDPADISGAPDRQAGAHPYSSTVGFEFTTVPGPVGTGVSAESAEGLKDLVAELPVGFSGDPQALPACPQSYLVRESVEPGCPAATRVGTLVLSQDGEVIQTTSGTLGTVEESGESLSVFNMVPEKGRPAELGFELQGITFAMYPSLVGSGADAHLRVEVPGLPLSAGFNLQGAQLTLFGDPAELDGGSTTGAPFLTNPSACSGEALTTTFYGDSNQDPGAREPDGAPDLADPAWVHGSTTTGATTGCGVLEFRPSFSLAPESTQADVPTGALFEVQVPQNEDPNSLATPDLRSVKVTLPEGMAVSPSAADGLQACTDAQFDVSSNDPSSCPAASQVGTVKVTTPILAHPLTGEVFIGAPECSPCSGPDAQEGKLLRLFLQVEGPGVLLKYPGRVAADPATGRLTATFRELTQQPVSDIQVQLKGGPRAPLTDPRECGVHTTTTELTSWSAPETPGATPASSFDVATGSDGAACPVSEAAMPNSPSFEAGTTTPIAGAYSPFVLKLSREDGSQRFSSIETTLPAGLLGRIAGVSECPDAAIAAAAATSGTAQKSAPSCPASSEVGVVNVGAGSGTPYYVQGHAYLAGPYKGAPLSLAVITPAVAGPFDLGTVVTRIALYVNESSTQIRAVSDPLPSILAGIPLDIRSIALQLDRPSFTLNPTNCSEKEISGSETSTTGKVAALRNRFQVGACKALDFKPSLKLSFSGQTKRTGNPAIKALLTQPTGDNANLTGAQVILPKGMLIDNAHINSPCTRVQFNSTAVPGEACPPKSVLGTAKVWTPLLEAPEEGKVYFRSNGGERELPDLVVALRGKIPVQLVGFIDSVGKKGAEARRVRTRFQGIPDAPVSRFELKLSGGKKGLLENSKNLCEVADKANYALTGQNGKTYDTESKVGVSCGKHQKSSKERHEK